MPSTEAVLSPAPQSPERVFDLPGALQAATQWLQDDRLDEAQDLLIAVLQRWPGQPDALHFLGVLRHRQGASAEGAALIRQALRAMPAHAGAWNNLGNLLLESQQTDEALQAYERSVAVAMQDAQAEAAADAWNNLSTVYRVQRRWADSETAARQAVALRPEAGDGWYNLSRTLLEMGRVREGLEANSRAVLRWPRHQQARDQVIRALIFLGEREQAAQMYRDWLAEDPGNPVIQHQLSACLGQAAPERASDAYVSHLFDQFAKSFDAKLQKLHYRAPELIARVLADHLPAPQAQFDIVDLGCGTGLCAPLVRPWARHLAGCDLSVGMLRQARQRGGYEVLHKAELVHYLDTQPGRFDVAVSADTLCYFGELGPFMQAAFKALRPGGWLTFSVEALPADTNQAHLLQPNGRYAHARKYLLQCLDAAGLSCMEIRSAILRREAGQDVLGHLVCARRPAM